MALLRDILYKVNITSTSGNMDVEVNGIAFDSRKVKPGFLFVAIKGHQTDGHEFIEKATGSGATVIVCNKLPDEISDKVTYITVKGSAKALGIIASNFSWQPLQAENQNHGSYRHQR